MYRVLISLYGDRLGDAPRLVILDRGSGDAEAVDFTLPPGAERCMGLTVDSGRVRLVAACDEFSHLVTFDAHTMKETSAFELPGVRDGHSVLVHGGRLHVVASGSDEIVSFDLAGGGPADRRTVWAPTATGQDTHHLNSMAPAGTHLLVSAFGVPPSAARSAPPSGYVYDVSAAVPVLTGINHPHALSVHEGSLYFCESRTGTFRTADRAVLTLDGYLRGCAWLPDGLVCLGTSAGRPPHGEPHGDTDQCAAWIVDPAAGAVLSRIPLGRFGPEIYDIALLPR
jgi:Domain of unknown function (DUF4915)